MMEILYGSILGFIIGILVGLVILLVKMNKQKKTAMAPEFVELIQKEKQKQKEVENAREERVREIEGRELGNGKEIRENKDNEPSDERRGVEISTPVKLIRD